MPDARIQIGKGMVQTLYDAIGLTPAATAAEIEARCMELGERYRPENNPGDAVSRQRFDEIEFAYATLLDPQKRAEYDRSITATPNQAHVLLGVRSRAGRYLRRRWKPFTAALCAVLVLWAAAQIFLGVTAEGDHTRLRYYVRTLTKNLVVECKFNSHTDRAVTCSFQNRGRWKVEQCIRMQLIHVLTHESLSTNNICSGSIEPQDVNYAPNEHTTLFYRTDNAGTKHIEFADKLCASSYETDPCMIRIVLE